MMAARRCLGRQKTESTWRFQKIAKCGERARGLKI
jgi:hypothetical protein